ncbi:MAG: molecular chaperone DnaJ [Cyanobium sp.]
MPTATPERQTALVPTSRPIQGEPSSSEPGDGGRGFGGSGRSSKASRRSGGSKRRAGLSKGDWGPMGKHPDLEAIVARQRLQLPLSGRLTHAQVNQAWKRCAAAHHPDRGGDHDTMQLVNGARDLLLGSP